MWCPFPDTPNVSARTQRHLEMIRPTANLGKDTIFDELIAYMVDGKTFDPMQRNFEATIAWCQQNISNCGVQLSSSWSFRDICARYILQRHLCEKLQRRLCSRILSTILWYVVCYYMLLVCILFIYSQIFCMLLVYILFIFIYLLIFCMLLVYILFIYIIYIYIYFLCC